MARPLRKVEEGRDVMLPIRNMPEARRFARQVRKQRSDEVHAAREEALAARKTQYDSERIGLKSQHERETKEERVERATLRAEAAAKWTSYAEEHNLPEQKKPRLDGAAPGGGRGFAAGGDGAEAHQARIGQAC